MYSSLAGQEVTLANVDTIQARLRRLAKLQPDKAEACLAEAFLISAAMAARTLPPGWQAKPAPTPAAPEPARPCLSRYNCLYAALSGGRKPPEAPHNAKFQGPFGQWVFLSADGTVKQGLTPTRSVSVPPAKVEEAIAKGREILRPKVTVRPSTVATMADLKALKL